MSMTRRRLAIRVVSGALVGLVVGAIASVNVVIFGGIEDGYEASIPEVFDESTLVGLIAVVVLVAGPVIGAIIALRQPPAG